MKRFAAILPLAAFVFALTALNADTAKAEGRENHKELMRKLGGLIERRGGRIERIGERIEQRGVFLKQYGTNASMQNRGEAMQSLGEKIEQSGGRIKERGADIEHHGINIVKGSELAQRLGDIMDHLGSGSADNDFKKEERLNKAYEKLEKWEDGKDETKDKDKDHEQENENKNSSAGGDSNEKVADYVPTPVIPSMPAMHSTPLMPEQRGNKTSAENGNANNKGNKAADDTSTSAQYSDNKDSSESDGAKNKENKATDDKATSSQHGDGKKSDGEPKSKSH